MSKIYFTLTGTKHYYGQDFLKKGMKIYLEKERDNEYDKEAIKVTCEGLGKIGYIANSSYTVIGDSMSAGRIYDKIGDTAKAKVVLVTDCGIICRLSKKSLLESEKKQEKICFTWLLIWKCVKCQDIFTNYIYPFDYLFISS